MNDGAPDPSLHPAEPHGTDVASRLNWLRAGVLGANDGIVSVAAIVVGVAAATTDIAPIATAALAALVGGAISMALGEYVSVSSSRDSTLALIDKERRELEETPDEELGELAAIYEAKGISRETAWQAARELTAHDALAAHLEAELKIDQGDIASPWIAAFASALAFSVGGVLPLLSVLLPPAEWRVPATFIVVLIALGATGALGARLGGSTWLRPMLRVLIGGTLALGATFIVGWLFGAQVA